MKNKIQKLIQKGVKIDAPESVEIGSEVELDRISGNNVQIYAGSKIFGQQIKYLIRSSKFGWIGALGFSSSAWKLADRDESFAQCPILSDFLMNCISIHEI